MKSPESLNLVVDGSGKIVSPFEDRYKDRSYKESFAYHTATEMAKMTILLAVLPESMEVMREDMNDLLISYRAGLYALGELHEANGLKRYANEVYEMLGIKDGKSLPLSIDLKKLKKAVDLVNLQE